MAYVTILRESLERKKKYLLEILEYTKAQEKVAHQEKFDEEAFSELVDKKEVLINNINEIDKGFTSVYDRVRTEVLENKDQYSDELKLMQGLIRECVDLGMKIESLEEKNRSAIEQLFSNSHKNARKVKRSKKVANKYYKSMSNGGVDDMIFYDKKK